MAHHNSFVRRALVNASRGLDFSPKLYGYERV